MSAFGLGWVLEVLASFHTQTSSIPPFFLPHQLPLQKSFPAPQQPLPLGGSVRCTYVSPAPRVLNGVRVCLSAHDTERLSPGGRHSLNSQALDSQRTAPEGSAGACDSGAQCPVLEVGLQHSQGHGATHETG